MSEEIRVNSSGVSALGLLGVLFVGLKLGGIISWSWWWVTVPFWGGLALVLGLSLLAALVSGAFIGISAFVDKIKGN